MLSIQPNMYLLLSNNKSGSNEDVVDGIPVGAEVYPDSDLDSVVDTASHLETVVNQVEYLLSEKAKNDNIKALWVINDLYFNESIDERLSLLTKVLVRIENDVSPELLAILLETVGKGVIRTFTDNESSFDISEQKLNLMRDYLDGKIQPALPSEASDTARSSGYSSDESKNAR